MNTSIFSSRTNIVFQQNGATAHTAKSATKMLEEKVTTMWGKEVWPGNSSDWTLIENIWSILKESANCDPLPTTIPELQARFEEKWNSLPVFRLQNRAQGFKTRVGQMRNNRSGHTTY